jgi:hypothetical protein
MNNINNIFLFNPQKKKVKPIKPYDRTMQLWTRLSIIIMHEIELIWVWGERVGLFSILAHHPIPIIW